MALSTERGPDKKRQKTYYFHEEWENEFLFTTVDDKTVCLICDKDVSEARKFLVERHHTTKHEKFARDFPMGSKLRNDEVNKLKTKLKKRQSMFTGHDAKANAATEASFKVALLLTKHKKPFTDGSVVKEAMVQVAETLFKDPKSKWSKADILSTIDGVQLGANTVQRRVSALSEDAMEQLDRDIAR